MSWLTIVQTVSTFVTGTFGTTLVIIAVAIAARGPCCTAAGAISGVPSAAAPSWFAPPGLSRRSSARART
jgi:hypothetical protein